MYIIVLDLALMTYLIKLLSYIFTTKFLKCDRYNYHRYRHVLTLQWNKK